MVILKGLNVRAKLANEATTSEVLVWFAVIALSAICLWLLVVLANNGYANIRLAINHCFLETPQQKEKDNLHDKINLYRDPFTLGYEPTGQS
jgi:hypothetical protein